MRTDLFKSIIETEHTYWVVARENMGSEYGRSHRDEDSILFIAIPQNIKRAVKYEDITLKQFEDLKHSYMDFNIFLSPELYPPFQLYMSFSSLHDGFPVTIKSSKVKEFITKAIELKSTNMYQFKALHDGYLEPIETELNKGKEATDE